MMKKSIKQILSLLLAAVMVIGFFPVSSVASEGEVSSDPDQVADTVLSSNTVLDVADDENDDDPGSGEEYGNDESSAQMQKGQNGLGPDGQDAEHAPAPGSSGGGDGDMSGGPGGTTDPKDDPEGYSSQPARLELKFGEDDKYTLRTLHKVVLKSPGLHARDWDEDEDEQYHDGHVELKKTQDDVLAVSFRDQKDKVFTFDTLEEFALSCKDWKGRPLSELEALDLSLYLTTQDDELGVAETIFNYTDGEPALFFSTNLLADLLLTKPNAAELERRQKEAEEAEKEQETGEVLDDGHTWSEWTVTAEATCTEDGSRERTCSDCNAVQIEAIPAASHSWDTDDEEAAATCTVCGAERETVNPYPVELDDDFWRQGGDGDAVESAEYWDALFGGVLFTGNWAEDLLTVAVSQVGYSANTANYIENMEGEVRYYTRYGDWAGLPYSEWDAMFVSFCLNYARIPAEAVPRECVSAGWIDALTARELFAAAEDYVPKPGDLVFFDNSAAGEEEPSCRVGIVNAVNPAEYFFTAIEGARNHSVEMRTYALTDAAILGYGVLPDNQELLNQEALAKAMPAQSFEETVGDVTVTVVAEVGAFPANTRMELSIIEDEEILSTAAAAVLNADSAASAGAENAAGEDETAEAGGTSSANSTTKKVARIRAVDISFYDEDGNEVEPAHPVRVTMKSAIIRTEKQADVVHIHDDGAATVGKMEKQDDSVSFETGSFSTFVIVETEMITTAFTSGDGQTYEITVSCGADEGFPEGWQLSVSELTEENEAYQDYLDKTMDAVNGEVFGFTYLKLLDISIRDENGSKVEPENPVEVSVRLMDRVTEDSEDEAETTKIVHFVDGNDAGVLVKSVAVEGDTVSFTADSFSAYAIVTGPAAIQPGWERVSSLANLTELASAGLYIGSNNNYYLTNTTANHSNGNNTVAGLSGIKRSESSRAYPTDDAALYYFEAVEGQTNQFYIYCLDGEGNKLYAAYDTGASGAPYSILLTSDQSLKTPCTLSVSGSGASAYWRIRFNNAADLRWYLRNNIYDAQSNDTNFYLWKNVGGETYGLDGKTYGLMYWVDGTMGKGLMSDANKIAGHLDGLALTVMSKPNNGAKLYVPDDSDLSFWTFHYIDEDYYHLTSVVDGSTKYLRIGTAEEGLSLVSTPDDNCKIRVVPGSGANAGKICLQVGTRTLAYSGEIGSGFQIGGTAGNEWLNLVEESELTNDYFMTYSAEKVSVSDRNITNGSRIIVYTRVWNEETKKYEFYAVDQDGSLVRCYESGDSIEWVGGRLNSMLWNFVEYYWEGTNNPNYYYELYNQYSDQFIAPQKSNDQILSDNTIGINLNGRRNQQYYSTIVAWDEGYYAYAGLKADKTTGKIVSCPISEAEDFYFAIVQDLPIDDELTPVPTVDHTQYGITMRMVNFGDDIYRGAAGVANDEKVRKSMSDFLGSDNVFHQYDTEAGLLNTALGVDGYPISKAGNSLSDWFAGRPEVNHLFIASTYSGTGYYEYDSVQDFAHLDPSTNTFVVYKELGSDSLTGATHKHGLFFPYNDITAGIYSVNKNTTTISSQALPETDPRKYETMYQVQKSNTEYAPDYYFGMEVTATFTQTPNGLDDWGHDIIYEFTGDDDFWLFVDGELIIDLGGIHSAISGDVNYRTGVVHVNGVTTSLRELFKSNYVARGVPIAEIETRLAEIFTEDGIFKDYTTHTMKIYYLERGAGSSNLHMRFNLASIKPGTVQLTKKLSGIDTTETILAEFPYQVLYRTKKTVTEAGTATETITEHYLTNSVKDDPSRIYDYVFYKDSAVPVTYKTSFTVAGITYHDVFILKPDETADISFPLGELPDNEEFLDYRIIECGVNTDVFRPVTVNGSIITGTAGDHYPANRKDFAIDYASTDDRARVIYDNAVDSDALRDLTITKKLYDVTGTTLITDDTSVFSFRLYLATETSDIDNSPANMHTYHVKDANGVYCYWDVPLQRIVPLPGRKTNYSDLTAEEKESATFHTSPNGSITKIPVGYTVEVREILAGTSFKVVERPGEIPDGYSFQKYVYNGTASTNPAEVGITDTVSADKNPHVEVDNLKGFGLRVNKMWADAEYMDDRDPTYFAVCCKDSGTGSERIVDGSVRQLTTGTTTLYWYFDTLPVPGSAFDDYTIYEVKVENPTVDENGVVTTWSSIEKIPDGASMTLNGKQIGETAESEFTYTVAYERGKLSHNSNVRVDTVTNSRPGIRIQKQDWSGHALANAIFTLYRGETQIGEYTSDSDGLITVAFLSEDTDYTLTETASPLGYYGLQEPMTVSIDSSGVLNVSGVNEEYYTKIKGTDGTWILTLKNRPYVFRALKMDRNYPNDPIPLKNVHFKLYREIVVDGVHSFDPNPMPGYEDFVSDADGMIPKLTQTLPAGKYELREIAPSGYAAIPYIQFTVSSLGVVEPVKGHVPDEAEFAEPVVQEDGSILYQLTVTNFKEYPVSIWKTNRLPIPIALSGAGFALYHAKDYDDETESPREGAQPILTGITDSRGILSLDKLKVGEYRLVETAPPTGYVPLTVAIRITVNNEGVSATQAGEPADVYTKGIYYVAGQPSGTRQIRVWNQPGSVLPSTGGIGTAVYYLVGAVMIAVAAAFLLRKKRRKDR